MYQSYVCVCVCVWAVICEVKLQSNHVHLEENSIDSALY